MRLQAQFRQRIERQYKIFTLSSFLFCSNPGVRVSVPRERLQMADCVEKLPGSFILSEIEQYVCVDHQNYSRKFRSQAC